MVDMRRVKTMFLAALALFAASNFARADIVYQACTPTNSYLENSFSPKDAFSFEVNCPTTPGTAPEKIDDIADVLRAAKLPKECVFAAQALTPEQGYRFAACNADGTGVVTKGTKKPCLSMAYNDFIYLSYLQSMRCLGMDPRELFAIFTQESNFQINIGSATGSWGVGQLTPVAVRSVNNSKLLAPLAAKQDCAAIRKFIETPMSAENVCQWVGAPANPSRNFVYSGLCYQIFKRSAERLVKRSKLFSKMKGSERARAASEIAAYMYNGGDAGVSGVFAIYSAEHSKPQSFAEFHEGFRQSLADNYGTGIRQYEEHPDRMAAKRKEVSLYAGGLDYFTGKVEKAAGVKCGL
jgi:hypothetical protein